MLIRFFTIYIVEQDIEIYILITTKLNAIIFIMWKIIILHGLVE